MGPESSRRPAIELKSEPEILAMRKAGRVAAEVLEELGKSLESGISTKALDQKARKLVRGLGGVPTFLGYRGYPATICVSLNEEVVHGIPSDRKVKDGDVVSIDFAATVDGFVGDTARTWAVGPVSAEAQKLLRVTEASLVQGIDAMKAGNRLGDVGHAIQAYVEKEGFNVVRDYVGHGIGRQMHEEPAVPNYGTPGTGMKLDPGLVLALEPMVMIGNWPVRVLDNGWTVVTVDGSWAAHFEHTVLVTETGPQILTALDRKI